MSKRDWIVHSKFTNHSRLNSRPDWGDNENLHFDKEEDIHMSSENLEANGYMHNLDLLIVSH